MRASGHVFLMTACFAITTAVTGRALAHPPPFVDAESEQRAADFLRKGNSLSREGKIPEAIEAYAASFENEETYPVAANLGSLELALGRYRDAAEHLAFAIRRCPPDASPATKEALAQRLAQAKEHVGALEIHVGIDNAEVTLDDKAIDWLDLRNEIFISPGVHTIAATRAGYSADRKTVEVKAGTRIDVELVPAALPSAPSAPPATLPAESGGGKSVPLLVAGASAATVGIVLGVAFTVVSNSKSSQATVFRSDLVARDGAAACSHAANAVDCGNLHGLLVDQATFANAAVWSFIAAGAFAAGTGVYALWPAAKQKPASAAGFRAVPTFDAQGAGVVVAGAF
jgi:tetratricopeptide (TPR) repeat protein